MAKHWLKLWTETITDRKLTRIDPAWRWAWVGLLCLAAETDDEGKIELAPGWALSDDEIAVALNIPAEDWRAARDYFLKIGMLTLQGQTLVVVNYAKRQASKDPTNAERQARYRNARSSDSNALRNGVTSNAPASLQSRVEAEAEAEAEELLAPDPDFADTYRFWCDKTTRSSGSDAVSMQAVFDEWKSIFDPEDIRAAILIAAQAKGMAATPAYLAGILRKQANARKNGNGALRMYEEATQ